MSRMRETFHKPTRLEAMLEYLSTEYQPPPPPRALGCPHKESAAERELLLEMGVPENARIVFCTECGWTWEATKNE